jgi:hypothetical protein
MKIYFIYECQYTHISVLKSGSGASELQFYMLAKKLSELKHNITIFNISNINNVIDNIEYRQYNDIINNINIDKNAIFIIMRKFNLIKELYKYYPTERIIIWGHDYIFNKNIIFLDNDTINIINKYNIKIVCVSEYHKNNLKLYIKPDNITVIYNILYTDIYKKSNSIRINLNNIVFASSWNKRLNKIINLFDILYSKYPNFRLILMCPSYYKISAPIRDYIILLNTITNKDEYCSIIESSLCTISSDFNETFGCVFAESYYLNTPVIATNKINGMHEFINNEHTCNIDNYDSFEKKLLEFYNNRPYVSLKSSLIDKEGLEFWIKYLDKYYQ